jgi:hypothetical protein
LKILLANLYKRFGCEGGEKKEKEGEEGEEDEEEEEEARKTLGKFVCGGRPGENSSHRH